jgi:ABC-type spermidine/putrescine transport system permease subunit II
MSAMTTPMHEKVPLRGRAWRALVWGLIAFFLVNVGMMILAVATNIESAARVFGANTRQMFVYTLMSLLAPGVLAAGSRWTPWP